MDIDKPGLFITLNSREIKAPHRCHREGFEARQGSLVENSEWRAEAGRDGNTDSIGLS
jgi:hypothetical protein